MRACLTGLILLVLFSLAPRIVAADAEDVAVRQVQTPAPPPAPEPFRIPPQTPPRQADRPAAPTPCVHYTMRLIPASPNVDPKFVIPRRDNGTKLSGRIVTPPPDCRPESSRR